MQNRDNFNDFIYCTSIWAIILCPVSSSFVRSHSHLCWLNLSSVRRCLHRRWKSNSRSSGRLARWLLRAHSWLNIPYKLLLISFRPVNLTDQSLILILQAQNFSLEWRPKVQYFISEFLSLTHQFFVYHVKSFSNIQYFRFEQLFLNLQITDISFHFF